MLFNSFTFLLLFLPVVVCGRQLIGRYISGQAAQGWLLLASVAFYIYGAGWQIFLLAASIVLNWLLTKAMHDDASESVRRRWLVLGLVANISLLAFYKYSGFMVDTLNAIGIPVSVHFEPGFPLGISFFTLTQLMYLVDCFQRLSTPVNLAQHAVAVSLFPYVISGPLVRPTEVVSQSTARSVPSEMVARGIYLFAIGLAKKVILADSFSDIADAGFGAAGRLSMVEAWLSAIAYTFQIYFDFSGYSDMAVGSAWMIGINIPQNFNAPFSSRSITEFWQRWHISLSGFITSYIYTPFLRSMGKATVGKSAAAVLVAMAIAGLWHGPAWTYVIFGTIHGAGLAVAQLWKKKIRVRLPAFIAWTVTFVLVVVAFVFFRAPSVHDALTMTSAMVSGDAFFKLDALSSVLKLTPFLLLKPMVWGVVFALVPISSKDLAGTFRPTLLTACITAALTLSSLLYMNSTVAKSFVYFAF